MHRHHDFFEVLCEDVWRFLQFAIAVRNNIYTYILCVLYTYVRTSQGASDLSFQSKETPVALGAPQMASSGAPDWGPETLGQSSKELVSA